MTKKIRDDHWTNPIDEWMKRAREGKPTRNRREKVTSVYVPGPMRDLEEELIDIAEEEGNDYGSRSDITIEAWQKWRNHFRWQQDVQEIKEDRGITLTSVEVQEAIAEM